MQLAEGGEGGRNEKQNRLLRQNRASPLFPTKCLCAIGHLRMEKFFLPVVDGRGGFALQILGRRIFLTNYLTHSCVGGGRS